MTLVRRAGGTFEEGAKRSLKLFSQLLETRETDDIFQKLRSQRLQLAEVTDRLQVVVTNSNPQLALIASLVAISILLLGEIMANQKTDSDNQRSEVCKALEVLCANRKYLNLKQQLFLGAFLAQRRLLNILFAGTLSKYIEIATFHLFRLSGNILAAGYEERYTPAQQGRLKQIASALISAIELQKKYTPDFSLIEHIEELFNTYELASNIPRAHRFGLLLGLLYIPLLKPEYASYIRSVAQSLKQKFDEGNFWKEIQESEEDQRFVLTALQFALSDRLETYIY